MTKYDFHASCIASIHYIFNAPLWNPHKSYIFREFWRVFAQVSKNYQPLLWVQEWLMLTVHYKSWVNWTNFDDCRCNYLHVQVKTSANNFTIFLFLNPFSDFYQVKLAHAAKRYLISMSWYDDGLRVFLVSAPQFPRLYRCLIIDGFFK